MIDRIDVWQVLVLAIAGEEQPERLLRIVVHVIVAVPGRTDIAEAPVGKQSGTGDAVAFHVRSKSFGEGDASGERFAVGGDVAFHGPERFVEAARRMAHAVCRRLIDAYFQPENAVAGACNALVADLCFVFAVVEELDQFAAGGGHLFAGD